MDRSGERQLSRGRLAGNEEGCPSGRSSRDDFPRILEHGEAQSCDLLAWSSNLTCLTKLTMDGAECLAIYKPKRGERPLYDFPTGTLYEREYAAYLLSRVLGWPLIPPTIVREGPLGIGSFQLFIHADFEQNYFTFGSEKAPQLRKIALFDFIANNADRKAGHCLLDRKGRIWAIDHGLTFNHVPKLRTVIWDFAGRPIPDVLLRELEALSSKIQSASEDTAEFVGLLSQKEMSALRQRIETALQTRQFPLHGPGRNSPWPPI